MQEPVAKPAERVAAMYNSKRLLLILTVLALTTNHQGERVCHPTCWMLKMWSSETLNYVLEMRISVRKQVSIFSPNTFICREFERTDTEQVHARHQTVSSIR